MGSAEQAREAILARITELAPDARAEQVRMLAEALVAAGSARVPAKQRQREDDPRRALFG
jgi:hypothetical protein